MEKTGKINEKMRTIKLRNNTTVVMTEMNENPKDNNHGIINYY